jgi:hypothetical protein
MTILNGAGDPLDSSAPVTPVTPFKTRLRNAAAALYRYTRRFAVTIGVIVAVILVSTITIDLGPARRPSGAAESGSSAR